MTADPVRELAFEPHQVARLRRQFAQLAPDAQGFTQGFYARLFSLAPLTRALFRQHLDTQGDRFMKMLGQMIDELDRPHEFAATLDRLAALHQPHGLIAEDVAPVATALLSELAERLGPDFDEAARADWQRLYEVAVQPMFSAAPDLD